MKYAGLITARGGSKRLPGKNIKPLDGIPLLHYTAKAAFDSKVDLVALSTDDVEISSVMRKFANTSRYEFIFRPPHLAEDDTKHLPVILHALFRLRDFAHRPDAIVLLQPTSPFRTAEHINEAIEVFERSGKDTLISVDKNDHRNGAIYIMKTEMLMSDQPYIHTFNSSVRFVMDDFASINIDTLEDFERAENALKAKLAMV
jgi:CMP-N-acetylneuraminic acid synthetase